MLATKSPKLQPIHHLRPTIRRPLQPKNTLPTPTGPTPIKNTLVSLPRFDYAQSNKENIDVFANPVEPIGVSLAEELIAVRKKLERLRLDKEKTEMMLQERDKFLDFQMFELEERGEFQKELENEVDRLYRLKQLKLVSTRMSPLRSLREKEIEKKSKEAQVNHSKIEDSEEMVDQCSRSSTESLSMSMESSCSTSASIVGNSTSNSTATSKLSLISKTLKI